MKLEDFTTRNLCYLFHSLNELEILIRISIIEMTVVAEKI